MVPPISSFCSTSSATFHTWKYKSTSSWKRYRTLKCLIHLGLRLLSITSVSPFYSHGAYGLFYSLTLSEHMGSETVKKSRSTKSLPSTNNYTSCPCLFYTREAQMVRGVWGFTYLERYVSCRCWLHGAIVWSDLFGFSGINLNVCLSHFNSTY